MKKLIFVCTILCLSLCMIYVNNSNCNAMVKEIHSNNIKKYIDEKETFIAYYDIDKNTTDIYTGTDIDVIINQKKCGIIHRKPKYPTKLLFGNIDILRKGHIINKIISYNSENDESERPTIIGSDDRVIVEAHKRYTMPVCATADLTIWHKDGNSSSATAFELGDRLLATAGHVLINDKGSFPRAARVRFGYINGISVRRYDEDNIAGYIYVGDATGKNFNSDNDYGFIVWKEGVSDYVGYLILHMYYHN